jgi:subtilisin family serine protease
MRMINASPTGSYAANQGQGARVGILDTGLDVTHPDIAPNLNLAESCSFILPGTPTADPQEYEADPVNCPNKAAVQDRNGHGTHVGGTVAAPINGIGVAGVAPRATLIGLHAGTANGGYFFTSSVVNGLIYAGDHHLDVVNMSFFADPWLFNCKNDPEQKAIVKAISKAAAYATKNGVVLVAAAGNESTDLDHPTVDTISPDYPPSPPAPPPPARAVGNNCVVLPQELPWVATISSVGPQKVLAFYSNYSNSKVDVTAPGGSSDQALNPYGRVLNAWSSTAPAVSATQPKRMVEDCETVGGAPVCALYGWIQGTSMASPHAAGVAALIRAAHPGMPPMAVEAMLQNTAMPMACPPDPRCTGGGQTNFYGNGLVDALAAGTR